MKISEINWPAWTYGLAIAGILVVAAVVLLAMGREPICQCGTIKLWHGVVASSENSQHLSDWYSPSHVIHGVAFYAVGWWLFASWPLGLRAVTAVAVEAAWEVFENTDLIINRYREAAVSLDYYGDSVINSLSDIGFMIVGFWLAARLPVRVTVGGVILAELVVGAVIRDNLTLNIIMLIYPVEAINAWQSGG